MTQSERDPLTFERHLVHDASSSGSRSMYGAVHQGDEEDAASDDGNAVETPLGSPVGVETAAAAARRQSATAFVPVVSSIFGVIIFMRLGFIVGVIGLLRTWAVIFVAFAITCLSIGSLSALASSRTRGERGGRIEEGDARRDRGFYAAVLGSAGEHAGPAIGGLLFLAFSVASAYYLLGFAEITAFYLGVDLKHHPLPWNEAGSWVTMVIASTMLATLAVGSMLGGCVKKSLQMAVFAIMMLSIGCNVLFLVVHNSSTATGASRHFLRGNLKGHTPQLTIKMFGEFFPAFCGVLAGAHLADMLITGRSKRRTSGSVPRSSAHLIVGTHKALAFSCLVYSLLSLVLAACVENGNLRKERFEVQLVVDSILGIPVIYLGITATTITSALSNVMGAASVFEWIRSPSQEDAMVEPILYEHAPARRPSVRGSVLAWAVSQIAIACGSVDTTIPIVSSTFLLLFAVVNFACFYHEIMSPTFSSSFMMYSKWSALVGFCLSVGALFLVMSTLFVGCMVAGIVGALVVFQSTIPSFMVRIRRQNFKEINTRRAVPANGTMPPHVELAESSQYSEEILPEINEILRSDEEHGKRIEMAALYVRDALHGRFLGEDYLSEGLHKLQYKRWYHALQFARMGNMTVLLGLSFFEVPSWCYFSPQCGDPQHVLMWDLPTLPREVTLIVELLSLAILGFESALKFQYLGKRLYFANKWRIAQMILVLSDATSVVLVALVSQQGSASTDQSEQFKPIVPSPIIRPLLLLTMSERLRSGFLSLLRVIPRAMDGLLTILVLIVIYAISGMVMFEGTEEGRQYFSDFGSAWLNMLILLTTANFPDVMMPAYEHARYTSIFFVSFLMIGLLLMMNLVFASIYQNYRQEVAQRAARFAKRRNKSLEFAFQLLPGEDREAGDQKRAKTISRETFEALIAELLRPVVSLFDATASDTSEWSKSQMCETVGKRNKLTFVQFASKIKGFAARQKIKSKTKCPVHHRRSSSNPVVVAGVQFVRSAWFEYFVDVVILGNLVAILFEIQAKIDQRIETYTRWEMFMPLFSCFYLVEMALKMYANPWRSYFESMKNRYDCVVTIVIFVAEVSIQVHYTEGMNWQWIRVLLLLRFLRCLRLLVALHSLSTMFSIVLQLLPNFTTLYGMLGIVMMEYAAIGVQIFGGKLRIGDARLGQSEFAKSNYFANNFNDCPSALTTLFELLVVNNWNVIMEGTELVTSKWSRIYFISFYVIANIMMLNLVIAFVVEAYFEQAAPPDKEDTSQFRPDRSRFGDSPTTGTPMLDSPYDASLDETTLRQLLLRRRSQVASRSSESVSIDEVL